MTGVYKRGLPDFLYFKPGTLEDACSLLAEHKDKAGVLAGGTDLLVQMRQRLSTPQYLIGLKGITGLDYIDYDEKAGLTLGAMTTLHSLTGSPVIREKYAILWQAARETSAVPLHFVSTIGGNICLDTRCIFYNQSSTWRAARAPCLKLGGEVCYPVKGSKRCFAVYQGDLAPALIALGARVKITRKEGERVIPLAEFFSGSAENPNVLASDEILTEIQIPPVSGKVVGSYQKLRVREAIDFPLASVAVVLTRDDGVFREVKVVLGAISPAPLEVSRAEEILKGSRGEEDLIEQAAQEAYNRAHPVDNLSIPPSYRRKMVKALFQRAIKGCQ